MNTNTTRDLAFVASLISGYASDRIYQHTEGKPSAPDIFDIYWLVADWAQEYTLRYGEWPSYQHIFEFVDEKIKTVYGL